MKIYLASSWRNSQQPALVRLLRSAGHDVYDFRNPRPGCHGFSWSAIDPRWEEWTPEQYRASLGHLLADEGFRDDMNALKACEACVMLQPCGRSSALELGYAVGAGKFTIAQLAPGEPELMLLMVNAISLSDDETLAVLAAEQKRRLPWPGYVKAPQMARTPAELAEVRARTVLMMNQEYDASTNMKFTCDDCPSKAMCPDVFDGYNTDGDCLQTK